MPEKVANDYATRLVAAINSSVTTFAVTSAIPAALVGGNFRVRIENADSDGNPTGINAEFLNVTSVSGMDWTVTRAAEDSTRFPAGTHAEGSVITHVFTAAAFAALVASSGGGGASVANSRILIWSDVEDDYLPSEYRTDSTYPREFVGPVDPSTLGTIVGPVYGDRWTPTEAPSG